MTEETENQTKLRLPYGITLSETILIAVLSALAYSLVFTYKLGYFNYFRIPPQFIPLSITEILVVASATLTVAWLVFGLFNVALSLIPEELPAPIARRLRIALPIYILFVVFFFLYDLKPWWWIPLAIVSLVMSLDILAFLLKKEPQKSAYLEKLRARDQRSAEEDLWKTSLVRRTADFLGPETFRIAMYLVLLVFIAYNAGYSSALTKDEFHVAATTPEAVVLLLTGDKMICAPFDRNTHTITPSMTIYEIPSDPPIEFRLEKIGPLRFDEDAITAIPTPTLAPTPAPILTPSPP